MLVELYDGRYLNINTESMREGDSMFIKYVLGNWRGKWPLGISKPG
jgi:hypothetical protein